MNRKTVTSFLALGIFSVIAQVVVLRELINGFYGNELFIGLVMASWLGWTALGSEIAAKYYDKLETITSSVGLVFFLQIFLIRLIKSYIGFPGELPDLIYGVAAAIIMPAPICLLLGMWWRAGTKDNPTSVNDAYFVETAGFILGGIVFSFFIVRWQEFYIAIFLFLLISVFCAVKFNFAQFIKIAVAVALIFVPLLSQLNLITTAYRYKGQELIETKNTLYGNIAVTRLGGQYNFFENSVPLGSTTKVEFVEELAHLALLQSSQPKRVLLLGGGFTGIVNEILKHPVQMLDYVEIDPELIRISNKYVNISGPRLNIIFADGRYYLNNTAQMYDVIIINLPPPATALINRYYTKEFFETAKSRLNTGGIFVNYLPYSAGTPSPAQLNLNSSIFKTLRSVFTKTIVLPDDTNYFISSTGDGLTYNSQIITRRFNERGIKTDFIIPAYISYRLTTDRIDKTLAAFDNNPEALVNRDLFPVSYYYQNIVWLDLFYPRLSRFFETISQFFWIIFAAAIVLTIILFRKKSELLSIGVAGFSLMSLEMMIIFIYQTFVGYLYHRIAFLIAALMFGMALGVLFGKRSRSLYKFHLGIIFFCCVLPFVLTHHLSEMIIILFAMISGFLCGAIFPIANKLHSSTNTGSIYSADLTGSCLGALLPSLVLIPVFGVYRTLAFVAVANLGVIILLFVKYLKMSFPRV